MKERPIALVANPQFDLIMQSSEILFRKQVIFEKIFKFYEIIVKSKEIICIFAIIHITHFQQR